ncbi:MAG: carbamoyl phosphate synthase large subunit [Candidatus Omnitrophica bacterium CG11_big_fil_rev_8_21_14_0_20_64_10]|nr:MAG: carbamoyl phosphate synthase large subunit [Candidatus Omnitrophica bacterium CG11_big_fil_rev_8_21_14_0_20_64_10]
MPKRTDIKKILIIGSGPIIISQACEFDYSGTQACKALREEGYQVVLVNSNPATIMTDPEFADRTYIEPITPEAIEKIIVRERPDALLPTLGGQTGLNVAMELARLGILERHGVEMIGARADTIDRAENRQRFKEAMLNAGLDVPRSEVAHTIEEAHAAAKRIGFPLVIRPAFTLGGTGGGSADNWEDFDRIARLGLALSVVSEVLIEESVEGWKEFELELMRDRENNCVVICSIENVDPMGVHTGDSITVAPVQTLTDRELQGMRDDAITVMRAIGVETGGSNIQFAVDPATGRRVVIEMNPRVSRSSALASKATGFPIAKIAAKLAVGFLLHELPNDITRKTPAAFEPTLDYCVVKIPRWAFEKFPDADPRLTIQMKSVGEVMAIGRNFKEALQKGLRSLEIGRAGLGADGKDPLWEAEALTQKLRVPNADRIFAIRQALVEGRSEAEIHEITRIDPWFLREIAQIVAMEKTLRAHPRASEPELLWKGKRMGFSDRQIGFLWGMPELEVRKHRLALGVRPVFYMVDTCAAEFEAVTPYYYSTYEQPPVTVMGHGHQGARINPGTPPSKKIMILGGGPNRIGQGIEFDYCCVHAVFGLKAAGFKTIMVNSNPETVSTDYDTADTLYFEPLTLEDVLNIIDAERPAGVIVQLGGQTPLNLALALEAAGAPIIGTAPAQIDAAEDRKKFSALIERLGLRQPPNGTAMTVEEAVAIADRLTYPVLVRPSYVLGGRAMEIVYDETGLKAYMAAATLVSPEHPILVDKFLEDAIEVDVDLIADGKQAVVGGMLEHVEQAGVHSGDAAMVLPPHTLSPEIIENIRQAGRALAAALEVRGLMNIQFAVKGKQVFVLEVNPRASRTIPFVSKAIGVPLAKLAARVMAGETLEGLGFTREVPIGFTAVKESVFPFSRFFGVDIILGPEMRSTGEVMGLDRSFGIAFAKSQIATYSQVPLSGTVFLSVKDADKPAAAEIGRRLDRMGFKIVSTGGTAEVLRQVGVEAQTVRKIHEGHPHVLDFLQESKVDLVINTPAGKATKRDEQKIRSLAVSKGIPCVTTIQGARALTTGIESLRASGFEVRSLQEWHEEVRRPKGKEKLISK